MTFSQEKKLAQEICQDIKSMYVDEKIESFSYTKLDNCGKKIIYFYFPTLDMEIFINEKNGKMDSRNVFEPNVEDSDVKSFKKIILESSLVFSIQTLLEKEKKFCVELENYKNLLLTYV